MNTSEFSNQFDVLYNNITSNQAPGLDEYEKSIFLTKAQDEIIKAYFSPKGNKTQAGFDQNEIRQIDFSMLIKSNTYSEFQNASFDSNSNTKACNLEDDILVFLNEWVEVNRGTSTKRLVVVPVTYTDYSRLMSKPYGRPLKNQAWRLLLDAWNVNAQDNRYKPTVELIVGPQDSIRKYTIRYLKRPKAIIIEDLENGLTINGSPNKQDCELDPVLHEEILQRAVELAKAAYTGDLQSQVALGGQSQTGIGFIAQQG